MFRIMTPKSLTPEQQMIFEQLKEVEPPVDQGFSTRMDQDSSKREGKAPPGGRGAEEDSGIFGKLKNMWSN